jgi:hypothetical protein
MANLYEQMKREARATTRISPRPNAGIYLLVGAGSSVHYGFPSGDCLLRDFQDSLRSEIPEDVAASLTGQSLSKFLSPNYSSIDALLEEAHTSGHSQLVQYGRSFVALRITRSEECALREHGHGLTIRWLEMLLDGIVGPDSDYQRFMEVIRPLDNTRCGLSINTLNYDRLLERSLINYLNRRFPNSSSEIKRDWVEAPQVYHCHGSVISDSLAAHGLEPGKPNLQFWWERSNEPGAWTVANKLLERRDVFAAIGFGFHQSIVDRFEKRNAATRLFCTDYTGRSGELVRCLGGKISAVSFVTENGPHCAEKLVAELLRFVHRDS